MENAVDAIIMGFSMLVFAIAIMASMYMFNQVANTSQILLYVSDKTNYFENIELAGNENVTTRLVDLDTVIPTLYRYYKENFCVKICDAREDGQNDLVQIFDVNIEGKMRTAASAADPSPEQRALITAYGDSNSPRYLFEAPWIGNTETDTKTRIDFYIQGAAGYINDTKVDYTDSDTGSRFNTIDSLAEIRELLQDGRELEGGVRENYELVETFVEYVFSGDTISTEDGTEKITGDKQETSKIIITYTLRKKA